MPRPFTRRELLRNGAGAAGAALLLPAVAARAQNAPVPDGDAVRMLKGVSLIGLANPYSDEHGVRPYLLGGARPTDVVTLWVSWGELQPSPPAPFTLAQSFSDLGDPAGPGAAKLAAIDAQIAQANADGRRVVLCSYQIFPSWTRPTGAVAASDSGQGRLGDDARLPDELGEDGPWAWFVAWLCARYADVDGAPTPGAGRAGAAVGNPAGAHVDWLAPMNEPNLAWWPQTAARLPGGTLAGAVARMMRTAAAVAARYRNGAALPQGPALLMPNTADVVGDDSPRGTPWRVFTADLLQELRGWLPETPVGWSQHNYYDVKYGPQTDGRWRAQETVELLRAAGWPDPAVWLTEGGYQFGVRKASPAPNHYVVDATATADARYPDVFAEQAAKLEANWRAMATLSVRLWTQYLVNDFDVRFQSSLRGPLRTAPDGTAALHEPPYPAYALWPTLTS